MENCGEKTELKHHETIYIRNLDMFIKSKLQLSCQVLPADISRIYIYTRNPRLRVNLI
jgi:hypothetical protein